MKSSKLLAAIAITAAALTSVGCSNKAADAEAKRVNDSIALADSMASADSIAQAKAQADSIAKADSVAKFDEKVKALIGQLIDGQKLYNDSFLRKHCTKKMQNVMSAGAYEGELFDGSVFRSNAQDGPSEKFGLISVEAIGDSWYKYKFWDMGMKYTNKVKVVEVDGEPKFDKVVHL